MNVDTLNSKYKVVSKYFASKTVMDESLSDFKEKKSFQVKTNKAQAKPKAKKVKRVKGQKDIRTVLKAKNELIAYSKDFDSICKTSGIDVDSEQLQLAIALSKSLQTTDSPESSSSSSKSLTTQQRSGLIRTTLKEYGFKVPEKPTTSRNTKKRRKPYKLLLTSEEEKQQIISDRYSQILFELNSFKTTTCVQNLDIPNLFIYNMATNVEYETIKDDAIFYVENIVEVSPNNMGCLLKNWSDIPGRILSPDANKSELLFSEVECSQEELDSVLSGPLKNTKDILKKNILKDRGKNIDLSLIRKNINATIEQTPNVIEENIDSPVPSPVFLTGSGSNSNDNNDSHKSNETLNRREDKNLVVITQPSRSLSPDLFDDEDDSVVEIPNETMTETEVEPGNNNITKQVNEVMDLTECVNVKPQKTMYDCSNAKIFSQLSQQTNVTKRKSNDFMEITECVGSSSQILPKIDEEIDLTGHSGNSGWNKENNSASVGNADMAEGVGNSSKLTVNEINKHIDLTAECKSSLKTKENKPCEIITTTTCIVLDAKTDEHIDLTGHGNNDMETNNDSVDGNNVEHMDLTQSSNSSNDTLPFVHIGGTQAVTYKDQDDTFILNENDYLTKNSSEVTQDFHDSHEEQPNQVPICPKSTNNAINIASPRHISEGTDEVLIINLDETCELPKDIDENVDLTQTSDSNEAVTNVSHSESCQINNSSLGKKDDVSVDYDEALENMNSFPYYDNEIYDNDTRTKEQVEISDDKDALSNTNNDLNSPPKNVENHFDFGGISVIDNLSSFNSKSRNTSSLPNSTSMRDSLPIVNVKGTCSSNPKSPSKKNIGVTDPINFDNSNEKQNDAKTPKANDKRKINVETPEQSEYIVKTDNVTPMLDYASMSTPERNKELDKYGLKPFKRKRAIQLLTHLYNQTHPYVESTEELPSPSKKQKTEDLSQPSSSKTSTSISPRESTKSPKKALKPSRKTSKSPRKTSSSQRTTSKSPISTSRSPISPLMSPNCAGDGLNDFDKENDLFMMTREVPVIKNIECDADDWVFQKREKAKLHTCRVPLHIAFHNFVSCRRRLHEAVLRYEPVNIDVLHKGLAASGHRYDPKELLKFLDKRCITVKTADSTKNNKRY